MGLFGLLTTTFSVCMLSLYWSGPTGYINNRAVMMPSLG